MSDYDDDYMVEDEDYDLEYSEDSNSEPDVDLENQYYNSKSLKENNPKGALESFQRVLDLENGEKGEWGFKALKQMIKINFRLQNYEEMMTRYKQLLTYIKSAVTRNHSEKSINSILDYISTSKQMGLLQNFYETTLDALRDAKNERLWFKTMTKLGKLYFDREEFNKLARILKQLRQSCQTDDGEDDLKKGTQLLEVYALEIQMYTAQKNNKKLKALYDQVGLIVLINNRVYFVTLYFVLTIFSTPEPPHKVRHPAPADPRRHPRVRRQDASPGGRVREGAHRLLRGF